MTMKVKVKLKNGPGRGYEIVIKGGQSSSLGRQIVKDGFGNSYCIITDSNASRIFGKRTLAQFKSAGAVADIVVFPAGEPNKGMETVGKILEEMLAKGFDRKSCVVALGGGVVGDVAGFAASIYLRGISFVQVPTTLLAMVDSSVGGKTGVDLAHGKNSAGTFAQPKKVYICPEFLKSLPKNEIRNGMAEVVKHAVIFDKRFFSYLEKNLGKIMGLRPKEIGYVIKRNCELKARVVEKDEREQNYRRVVNYGHTIGHALEVLGKYRVLSHGEAISIGMVSEALISCRLGYMKYPEAGRIAELLHKIGLPIGPITGDLEALLEATRKDKKAVSGKVYYSLPSAIGKMVSVKGRYGVEAKDNEVMEALGCSDDSCSCCCENC